VTCGSGTLIAEPGTNRKIGKIVHRGGFLHGALGGNPPAGRVRSPGARNRPRRRPPPCRTLPRL